MAGISAKQTIVDTFIDKVEAGSLRTVQVAKLIKEIDINRNTFYYHFPSKYDVALYVFRTDLAQYLEASFPEDELLFAPVSTQPGSEQLAYYTHREIGARTLDFGGFFKALVRCVINRSSFYGKLFDSSEREFRSLTDALYRPAVQKDLEFVLGGRYLPSCTFDLFLTKYTGLVYETAEYYLKHSRDAERMLEDTVNPFWNMPYEALVYELQMHTVNHVRRARD